MSADPRTPSPLPDTTPDEFVITTAQGEVITYRRGNEGYWSATQEGMPDHWWLSRVASRAVEELARLRSPAVPRNEEKMTEEKSSSTPLGIDQEVAAAPLINKHHGPGRELDALVAECVMGLTVDRNGHIEKTSNWHAPPPEYSTDIAAAWEVVERLGWLNLYQQPGGFWWACFYDIDDEDNTSPLGEASAATASLAICLAALKTVGA